MQYRVDRGFHFGPASIDLRAGTVLEFDGQVMTYGGKTYPAPGLSGAINAHWLISEEGNGKPPVKPAPVMVKAANPVGPDRGSSSSMGPTVVEEVPVGSLAETNARRKQGEVRSELQAKSRSTSTVVPPKAVVGASKTATTNGPKKFTGTVQYEDDSASRVITRNSSTVMASESEDIVEADYHLKHDRKNEDERPVARILTSAKQGKVTLTDSMQAASLIKTLDPVHGKPATKTQKIGAAKVAKATPTESVHRHHENGASGDVATARSGDNLEDLLPDAASSGVPASTGFEWSTEGHWRERVKKAVTAYGNNPAALEKIYAKESEAVVKHIQSQVARQ